MHLKSWPKFCAAGEKHRRRGMMTAELSGQSPAARLRSCDSVPRALRTHGEGQGQVKILERSTRLQWGGWLRAHGKEQGWGGGLLCLCRELGISGCCGQVYKEP